MRKILITAPLRQDVDIFEAYQEGLTVCKSRKGTRRTGSLW